MCMSIDVSCRGRGGRVQPQTSTECFLCMNSETPGAMFIVAAFVYALWKLEGIITVCSIQSYHPPAVDYL